MAANEYVGFYWTLPVNWAGFRDVPTDANAAAVLSKTIRYQQARVKAYVAQGRGVLLAEIAFCDVRHDCATDAVRSTLRRYAAAYAGRATLLYVRFHEVKHWRPNIHLVHEAEQMGLFPMPLSPDPVLIDDVAFDPARHFREWRHRDRTMKKRLDAEATAALRAALDAVEEPDRWQTIATRLNADGIRTVRGGVWTVDGVRKAAHRLNCRRAVARMRAVENQKAEGRRPPVQQPSQAPSTAGGCEHAGLQPSTQVESGFPPRRKPQT